MIDVTKAVAFAEDAYIDARFQCLPEIVTREQMNEVRLARDQVRRIAASNRNWSSSRSTVVIA